MIGSARRRLLIALLFLLPSLVGFLVFTAGPIAFSLAMSVTDWALTKHNPLSDTPIRFVGFENFLRILVGDESHLFWDYFGNTLFLMIGIPIGIAGSLGLALLLSARVTPTTRQGRTMGALWGVALTAISCAGVWASTTPGGATTLAGAAAPAARSTEAGLTDLTAHEVQRSRSRGAVLATAALGVIVTLGLAFGTVFFRTIFYLPSLLAGVALFLLWKTLYKPRGGLINAALGPVLDGVQAAVGATPPALWYAMGLLVWGAGLALCARVVLVGASKLRFGDAGLASFLGRLGLVAALGATVLGAGFVLVQLPARSLLPSGFAPVSRGDALDAAREVASSVPGADAEELRLAASALGDQSRVRDLIAALTGAAGASPESAGVVRRAVMNRASRVREGLTSGEGLAAPEWLVDSSWAKTALIVMGVWAGLGGSTMLLYLAGLSNIPPELYEASAIDGASGWNRFIHVTWPQLAPTTFFIVIMATIGGLQGGFEQAMVMTQGKADTIVLAYYIYNIAFTDQFQLGLASAIAWVMFAMIFAMTVLNFRLGSQLTNE
ncbi:MAG TPA: hypothetical protein DEB06_08355 [Phycisphaerales bacterium]|nr:hypothetical protein [Phycisphaerales bacterium]